MKRNKRANRKQRTFHGHSSKEHHKITRNTDNPLLSFLSTQDPAEDSRIQTITRHVLAESFDLPHFKAELEDKLKRLQYTQPFEGQAHRHKKTFYQLLESAGALPVLLHSSTLKDLWLCLLLRSIVQEDRHLADANLSIKRFAVRFHDGLAKELERHLDSVDKLARNHNIPEDYLRSYIAVVQKVLMKELRLLALSRWPGSRRELLSGRRDEDVATNEALFRSLRASCAKYSLPDSFLRQLALLISAPANVKDLPSDLTLAKAIWRRDKKDK